MAFCDDSGMPSRTWIEREPQYRVPQADEGIELLPQVQERLDAATGSVVLVTAPGGYGKTTQLSLWLQRESRDVAWISLHAGDNDPVLLLGAVLEVLTRATNIDADSIPALRTVADIATVFGPALGAQVARITTPFVLVMDDVNVLEADGSIDLLDALASNVPRSSTIVFAGRSRPRLPVGRLRVRPGLTNIDVNHLQLPVEAADQLLRRLGLSLGAIDVNRVLAHTEGWPVGLRLAGLLLRDRTDIETAIDDFTGSDRSVADYLKGEWLRSLEPDEASFMLQVAAFDWFSGEMCDEVLDRTGSAALLDRLHAERSLVVPLDRRGEWFRLHHLLAKSLQDEARRRDPHAQRQLNLRASRWFEESDDIVSAVDHAMAAGELRRAASLVVRHGGWMLTSGHHITVQRWLADFPVAFITTQPELAVMGVGAHLGAGDCGAALQWLRICTSAIDAGADVDEATRLQIAMFSAALDTGPLAGVLGAARLAHAGLPPGPFHVSAAFTLGALLLAVDEPDEARRVLAEGEAEGRVVRAYTAQANCAAVGAMVAAFAGDWQSATDAAHRARGTLDDRGVNTMLTTVFVPAVNALVDARGGDIDTARRELLFARRTLALFADVAPCANLLIRAVLARTCLFLGDRSAAGILVDEARRYLDGHAELVGAARQLAEVDAALREAQASTAIAPSGLTTAELRVLHYLPTNLQLTEIARRLYLSRNTVKTHTISIYSKLGVHDRSAAVDAAQRVGLLDPGPEL